MLNIFLPIIYLSSIAYLNSQLFIPDAIAVIYVSLSLITLIAFFIDKRSAIKNTWRIKESTLHLLALIGGWPGALIAQKVFRHKTKKQPFKAILWAICITHIGTFVWFAYKFNIFQLN